MQASVFSICSVATTTARPSRVLRSSVIAHSQQRAAAFNANSHENIESLREVANYESNVALSRHLSEQGHPFRIWRKPGSGGQRRRSAGEHAKSGNHTPSLGGLFDSCQDDMSI